MRVLDCALGGPLVFPVGESFVVALPRLVRRGDFGRLEVRLALVALMKLELATLRMDVGKARKILWEYGTALLGAGSFCVPMLDSCDGGIQGANKWIRPRICWGFLRAVANA